MLYALPAHEEHLLDGAEGLGRGYHRTTLAFSTASEPLRAFTYVAMPEYLDDDLRPFTWYHELVVAGAAAWGLPERYVACLRAIEVQPDPDLGRVANERRFFPCGGS